MNRLEELLTGGVRGGRRCRAEGSLAIGDGGQAAISLMPDVDGTHVRIFESLQLEGSYVGDLLQLLNKLSFVLGCLHFICISHWIATCQLYITPPSVPKIYAVLFKESPAYTSHNPLP